MNGLKDDITLPYEVFIRILAPAGTRPQGLANVLLPDEIDNAVDGGAIPRWRAAQSGEILGKLDEFLPILTDPRWVSRISIIDESGGFLSFLAIRGDSEPQKPVLVCSYQDREREVRVSRLPTLYHLAGDLNDYITPGPPLLESHIALSVPGSSFLILCAMADLMRRRLYSSLLDHTTLRLPCTREDIANVVRDARESRDPRWLLPHLFSLLPDDPAEYLKGDLSNEFTWLERHNYLIPGKNRGEYLCSDTCMDFLKLLNAGTCRMGIMNLHKDGDTGVMIESACFIRVPRAILAMNIGNDKKGVTAVLTNLNFEQLLEFTIDFLAGTGIPPGPAPSPMKSGKSTAPAANQAGLITCPYCNASLPSSAIFCRKCGKKVNPGTP